MPYFSILEVPIKRYMQGNQLDIVKNSKKKFKKMLPMLKDASLNAQGTIGLFKQINEETMKHMKKKVNQSPSVNVKKFRLKNDS